jgi:hypothetical protein
LTALEFGHRIARVSLVLRSCADVGQQIESTIF